MRSAMRKPTKIAAALALLVLPAMAQPAQRHVYLDWAPKPDRLPEYAGPNKPVTRMSAVLFAHAGQKDWSEPVVETERYSARWVSLAPGEKTRTQFYADDRTFFVVWGGKLRFTIQGQQPFVATKGFLVQVPLRVPYSMETVGDEPSLRFEVTHGGALPSYPATKDDATAPPPRDGQHYVKVSYPARLPAGGMDSYGGKNRPYFDFFKDIVAKYPTGGPRTELVMGDHDNQAMVIRGMGVPIPPDSNLGHFHIGNDEFWFVMEGKIAYQIEGKGLLVADPGDVVLALPGRFHRASFAPGQMDTRLAFNRSPTMQHNYGPDANGSQ